MFESEKSRSYVAIHDQFYLKCSGVWNDHYYVRDRGGKDELQTQHTVDMFNITAAVAHRVLID